jgi:hypothetical protein
MTDGEAAQGGRDSPLRWALTVLGGMWRDMVSVYYANTLVWRALKSGALVFLGLFCWVGANLTLSYVDWTPLRYVMAYGFALLLWGPLTHLVVVPLVIRLRRTATHPVTKAFSRHGSKLNLTVFVLLVLVLGTVAPGMMTFEFGVDTGSAAPDVTGELQCTKTSDVVRCSVENPGGFDRVAVLSGGETIRTDVDPPYEFELRISELATVNEGRQFTVELRDEDGSVIRRYVRQVALIPER